MTEQIRKQFREATTGLKRLFYFPPLPRKRQRVEYSGKEREPGELRIYSREEIEAYLAQARAKGGEKEGSYA